VLIPIENVKTTTYSSMQIEERGIIFLEQGTEVYAGMIVSEHNRENDLTVNISREQHLTNMRTSNKDQIATIRSTRKMSLEDALQYIDDDEYCEVTPKSIRLRKQILNQSMREKAAKKK